VVVKNKNSSAHLEETEFSVSIAPWKLAELSALGDLKTTPLVFELLFLNFAQMEEFKSTWTKAM